MIRRRKIKTVSETSLVTNQDEAAVNNQVVFQKGLRSSTTSSLQEHFNNHFGKVNYKLLYKYPQYEQNMLKVHGVQTKIS